MPTDMDMREDGATSTAALLIWERRELHDLQEPCSPHVRPPVINRPNRDLRNSPRGPALVVKVRPRRPSVLMSIQRFSARALSYESPTEPKDASTHARMSRVVSLMDVY